MLPTWETSRGAKLNNRSRWPRRPFQARSFTSTATGCRCLAGATGAGSRSLGWGERGFRPPMFVQELRSTRIWQETRGPARYPIVPALTGFCGGPSGLCNLPNFGTLVVLGRGGIPDTALGLLLKQGTRNTLSMALRSKYSKGHIRRRRTEIQTKYVGLKSL